MNDSRGAFCTLIAVLAFAMPSSPAWSAQAGSRDDRKPSLALKATPPVGFSPLRVRIVVDARGGADDYADFYCPSIEWDWDDGTVSENSADCDPYEPGKSRIDRRWTAEHLYRRAGSYKATFRIKQKDKAVATSVANIQVRAGVQDNSGQ